MIDIVKLKQKKDWSKDEQPKRQVDALVIPPIAHDVFDNFEDLMYSFEDIHNQPLAERQEIAFDWVREFLALNRDALSKAV